MSTRGYTADLEDIRFVLFQQLDAATRLAGYAPYEAFDQDTYDATVEEAARIAEEVLAPANRAGDEEGVHFDGKGNVTTPAAFKEAWAAISEGGWIGVDASDEVGGIGMPHLMHVITNELFSGAATAFTMYPGLTAAAARVIATDAPEAMRELVATKMFTGEWAGTMCLTEAGAGTDVGSNRCKATRTSESGIYELEGEKIFISGGDHDLTSNIVHLVLARTPDAPSGTRGLSLFLVPKFLFSDDGELGERNGVFVGNIEHKMGITGSATCTLLLGDRQPCKAWIVGEEGGGIGLMFHMMNEARLGVGNQGLGLAVHAYGNALAYARERLQGSSIENFKDADAPKVAIIEHPDVRRMLLRQRSQIDALRSLICRLGFLADVAEHDPDDSAREQAKGRIDLLTPLVKAHGTDVGFECTNLALQVLGGYGYIREYPVEQHVRDARIGAIYEGTNGVQALDLLGRKLRMKGGALFMSWMQDAGETIAKAEAAGFGDQAGAVGKALQQIGATAMHLGGLAGQGQLPRALLGATPFLRAMGIVTLAIESLEQAVVAKESGSALAGRKSVNLRFYVAHVLPEATALAKGIQADDGAALEEAAFA